jgi:hypothetical protein
MFQSNSPANISAGNKLAANSVHSFSSKNMNASRTTASLRVLGQPLLAAALALLFLFSALASASPSLHHWLHGDHQTPSHYCVVTALEHGHSDVSTVAVIVPLPAPPVPVAALPIESFFVSHDLTLHPERGPPVLS